MKHEIQPDILERLKIANNDAALDTEPVIAVRGIAQQLRTASPRQEPGSAGTREPWPVATAGSPYRREA
jgi:hypothetical protein